MMSKPVMVCALIVLQTAINSAAAQPVSYVFSTGVAGFNMIPELSGTSVSGSFVYDSAAPLTFTTSATSNPANASAYGGHLAEGMPYSSYTTLNATVSGGLLGPAGFSFSDPRGQTFISNDGLVAPPGTPAQDFIGLDAEPFGAGGTHNIVPFSFAGYTLWNMRLSWIEPLMGGDFLNDQSLPTVLPSQPGRVILDFVATANTAGTPLFSVFYEGVNVRQVTPIPEPETYAMLLAGLALLGFEARRRKRLQHTAG